MFTIERVRSELEESKELPVTSQNAQDLAALIIIHDHMCKEPAAQKAAAWEPFGEKDAMKWTAHMKGEDPEHPTGPRWKPEEVRALTGKVNMPESGKAFWEFYAVMNAMYSDYYGVAKKYGLEKNPMFFADLAVAFVDDVDAVEDKTAKYYRCIVKS